MTPALVLEMTSRSVSRREDGADAGGPWVLLDRAVTQARAGDGDAALGLLERAQAALPVSDEPALRVADALRMKGVLAPAATLYEGVLETSPSRKEALLGLGLVLTARCEVGRAQMLLVRGCGVAPGDGEMWSALGLALSQSGDMAAAYTAFAEAARLCPAHVGFSADLAQAALQAGGGEAALARFDVAAEREPFDVPTQMARAVLQSGMGRAAEALETLDVVLALDPDLLAAVTLQARLLVRENQVPAAIAAFEAAIALAPDDLSLRNNLAATLFRQHRYREACTQLEGLIAEHGDQPGFLCNLTNALVSLAEHDAARVVAMRAIGNGSDPHLAWRTLSNALPYAPDLTAGALLDALKATGAAVRRGTDPVRFDCTRDPGRRLRVGLLSNTLRTHPVGWLTLAGFEHLDPAAFEIVCFGQSHRGDMMSARFQARAAEWVAIDMPSAAIAAARIRQIAPDIVIDLGGYGDQGLLTLCAQRVAPVQIKWVGSQNHSTGLAEMDYFISDRWETPPELSKLYTERLLVMPDGYVCYSPPAYAPDVGGLPVDRNELVTFGCFNNMAKLTGDVLAAWAAILRQVPRSRLVLKCHQFGDAVTRNELLSTMAALGIPAARIELRGSSRHTDLLREYHDIDFVLDPFPYSGGLTTCEALWMGVPTLTMPGETFASRHSMSHMCNLGLADWVAVDIAGYVALAVAKAGDVDALRALRRSLRARMRASPLCDGPRFGRNLAAALRQAWGEWCQG